MSVQTRIDTKQQTVRQILSTDFRYVVPAHQRDFAWRAAEEVKQLWDDIVDAMDQARPDYFLGTIVVTEITEDKTRSVIDGQQRLAVLTMILAAIRSVYQERGDERAQEVYNEYLGVRDRRTRTMEPRLTLNRMNQNAFQDLIIQHVEDGEIDRALKDKGKGSSDALLLESFQLIRQVVEERSKIGNNFANFLLDLEDFVADKVVLILVAVGDDADAYLIFETLNDRGLDLSISDLLKNHIYSRAGTRLPGVQKQWEEMTFLLGSQDATQFLRHYYWLSKYGVVRERELYKELRRRFQARQQILTLMTELRDAADKYAAMSNVDHAIWTGYSTQFRKDLEALQLFGLSQFRPLLLAALDRLKQQQVERIVRMIVVISMRYSIIGSLTPSAIERAYSDAAIRVRGGEGGHVGEGLRGLERGVPRRRALQE
jgi:hypothetical protein